MPHLPGDIRYPIKVKITFVATGKTEIHKLDSKSCLGAKTMSRLIPLLDAAYSEPNFKWEIVK